MQLKQDKLTLNGKGNIVEKKFVIWGAGIRGKRILKFLGNEKVIAFIEMNNEKVGGFCEGVPIISYEKYKQSFLSFFIIISPLSDAEIINRLKKDKIIGYFSFKGCPSEIISKRMIPVLEKFPYEINKDNSYAVLGDSLFALLLLDYLQESECKTAKLLFPKDVDENLINKIKERNGKDCIAQLGEKFDIVFSTVRIVSDKILEIYKESIAEAYDFSNLLPDYYNPQLEGMKGIHSGEKCFIVGTGPSLTFADLDSLQKCNAICFSMNMIFKGFHLTKWRPKYYIVEDADAIRDYWREIVNLKIPYKFVADNNQYNIDEKSNIYQYHVHVEEYLPDLPKFSEDISRKVYSGYTVTYVCLQFAMYMGFTEIYLIGIDFNYINDVSATENHFISNYHKESDGKSGFYYEECLASYESAKKYADSKGIKIYNVTRGGKLEVFPRKTLEESLNGYSNKYY